MIGVVGFVNHQLHVTEHLGCVLRLTQCIILTPELRLVSHSDLFEKIVFLHVPGRQRPVKIVDHRYDRFLLCHIVVHFMRLYYS